MSVKRGIAYAAAIAGGAFIGLVWGGPYFGPEMRALIGAGVGYVAASVWMASVDRSQRETEARNRALAQFERDFPQ